MKLLGRLSSALLVAERALLVVLLGGMVALAFLQVVLRNVFGTGFLWADPVLRHAVLWIGFIGASAATMQHKHISIDIFTRLLSPRGAAAARAATHAFASSVCVFLAGAGLTFLQGEIESGGTLVTIGSAALPAWWFQVVIPAGFGLMAFRFALAGAVELATAFRPASRIGAD